MLPGHNDKQVVFGKRDQTGPLRIGSQTLCLVPEAARVQYRRRDRFATLAESIWIQAYPEKADDCSLPGRDGPHQPEYTLTTWSPRSWRIPKMSRKNDEIAEDLGETDCLLGDGVGPNTCCASYVGAQDLADGRKSKH